MQLLVFLYKLFYYLLTISGTLAATLDVLCHLKNFIFLRIWVITCGIKEKGSKTRHECSSTCLCGIVNLNKHADAVFFWMIHPENFVSELKTCMDIMEEYADEESPYTECALNEIIFKKNLYKKR